MAVAAPRADVHDGTPSLSFMTLNPKTSRTCYAGGMAELQRRSGAAVKASPASASVLKTGLAAADDHQLGGLRGFPPVARVEVLHDGEAVRVGLLVLTRTSLPAIRAAGRPGHGGRARGPVPGRRVRG